jgi:hypothetical protein
MYGGHCCPPPLTVLLFLFLLLFPWGPQVSCLARPGYPTVSIGFARTRQQVPPDLAPLETRIPPKAAETSIANTAAAPKLKNSMGPHGLKQKRVELPS